MPFSSPNQKPTRSEALEYYRKVAEHYKLDVRQYENVERVTGADGEFSVHTTDKFGRKLMHKARKLIVSTGYYDLPNYLEIPGEALPKVKHYYHEPHPYFGQDVVVIGGQELGGDCGAGSVAAWGAGDAGASRGGAASAH